jgi:hypothetical protein
MVVVPHKSRFGPLGTHLQYLLKIRHLVSYRTADCIPYHKNFHSELCGNIPRAVHASTVIYRMVNAHLDAVNK